jgi:hypothetical protein
MGPSQTSRNFSAQVSEWGPKKMTNFPINFQAIIGNYVRFFKTLKNGPLGGRGASPTFLKYTNLIFCDLKPHTKYLNPMITPSGRKVTTVEREKRKKTLLIVDT